MLKQINFKEHTNCSVDFFKKPDNYNPISCDIYDHLEIWAMKDVPLSITYELEGDIKTIQTKIKTLSTKDGVEYLVTTEDKIIRLDHLHSIIVEK